MQERRLATLAALGLNFTHVIDVGANRGLWTKEAMQHWPQASFLLVEANPMHRKTLSAIGHTVVVAVVGDADKNVSMWESKDGRRNYHDTGNSLFKERTGKSWWGSTTLRRMTTLDAVLERNDLGKSWTRNRLPVPSRGSLLLKMDVQGAEKLVLQGSMRHVVPRAGAILAELSVHQYNRDAPLAFEMITSLAIVGYKLFDVLAMHYTRGLLFQLDCLFLREDNDMWKSVVTGLKTL